MNKYTKANFGSSEVVTIDIQRDTLDRQPLEVIGTSAILPRVRKILDVYRQKRMPIVPVVRIYKKDGGNVDMCRKA
jgi:nicotinamidase-related amidase